jgi:hypothetical protein
LRAAGWLALVATVLATGACGGQGDDPGEAATHPNLCGGLRAKITGTVSSPEATELSGLAVSRSQHGVLWTHNDSGDRARVLAFTTRGRLLADLAVPNATNVDWEDLAIGPGPRRGDALYLADIGDNLRQRPEVVVYRVAEPHVPARSGGATSRARRLALRYPDGAHDAEALLVNPSSGALLIVTKDFSGVTGVYAATRPRPGHVTTLRRVARLTLRAGQAITAGDISADGRTVALRSYFRPFVWIRRRGESVPETLRRRPCDAKADLLGEGQGEALGLTRDGRAFFTVPEGPQPPIRRYSRARSESG